MLFVEQLLNGPQFGVTLFLMSAGLTLIFGIMGVINLTHGSFYMIGAYAAAYAACQNRSILIALLAGLSPPALRSFHRTGSHPSSLCARSP